MWKPFTNLKVIMMRVARDTDWERKFYFLSRSTCVGVNTINKLHRMGVETLPEGHNPVAEKLVNPCSKMGSPATCTAFVLLSGVLKCGSRSEFSRKQSFIGYSYQKPKRY